MSLPLSAMLPGPPRDPRPIAGVLPGMAPAVLATLPGAIPVAGGVILPVPGRDGRDGKDAASAPVMQIAGAPLARGSPVYVSRASRQALPARAETYLSAFVAGLAESDTESGFPVGLVRGAVALDDWTAVTGTPDLLVGCIYFLAPLGVLTTVPPARPDSEALTRVGIALTPRVLDVNPAPPIHL